MRTHSMLSPDMPRRECVTLSDMTDCLLQAYDCVARRAYEIFLERGGTVGGELDDWLSAERELLGSLPVDVAEGDDYVSALASLPGLSGEEIEVGIDPRWIVILGRRRDPDGCENYPDPHRVAEFSRAVSADARTLRLACPHVPQTPAGAQPAVESPTAENILPVSQQVITASKTGSSKPLANPGSAPKVFCVVELPAEVDPERSVAVLANGILGIRMPKASPPPGPPC